MSNNSNFILCIQMPNQPQTILEYPDEKSALDAIEDGLESNIIRCKAETGHVVVNTVPGTVYIVLSKSMFWRQSMRQQLTHQEKR